MRILYIDPISPKGHINYNRIQLKALINDGGIVDCACIEGFEKSLGFFNGEINFIPIPSNLKYHKSNPLFARISQFRILQYIKKIFF